MLDTDHSDGASGPLTQNGASLASFAFVLTEHTLVISLTGIFQLSVPKKAMRIHLGWDFEISYNTLPFRSVV